MEEKGLLLAGTRRSNFVHRNDGKSWGNFFWPPPNTLLQIAEISRDCENLGFGQASRDGFHFS